MRSEKVMANGAEMRLRSAGAADMVAFN